MTPFRKFSFVVALFRVGLPTYQSESLSHLPEHSKHRTAPLPESETDTCVPLLGGYGTIIDRKVGDLKRGSDLPKLGRN